MVSGHLSEKNGHYYAVLNYKDALGKRKTKWIATGLPVKGNKKKAEAFLNEQRRNFVSLEIKSDDLLFADFMVQWLGVVKSSIATTPTLNCRSNRPRISAALVGCEDATSRSIARRTIRFFA